MRTLILFIIVLSAFSCTPRQNNVDTKENIVAREITKDEKDEFDRDKYSETFEADVFYGNDLSITGVVNKSYDSYHKKKSKGLKLKFANYGRDIDPNIVEILADTTYYWFQLNSMVEGIVGIDGGSIPYSTYEKGEQEIFNEKLKKIIDSDTVKIRIKGDFTIPKKIVLSKTDLATLDTLIKFYEKLEL